MSSNFRGQHLLTEYSFEQEIYPEKFLDKKCIEDEFQGHPNYNVDLRQTFLTPERKMIFKCRDYEFYNPKEFKSESKDE